jgi:hypothetical protein
MKGWALPVLFGLVACGSSSDDAEDSTGQDVTAAAQHIAPGYERAHQKAAGNKSAAEIQEASLHLGNAYWLAQLSWLAYEDNGPIDVNLKRLGFPTNQYRRFYNTCTNQLAYYFSGQGYSVLAYKGTQQRVDFAFDAAATMLPWWGGGFVHSGFFARFDSLWGEHPECGVKEGIGTVLAARHRIDPHTHTAPGGELYLTGHSLGAAMAGITLAELQAEVCGPNPACNDEPLVSPSALYTYGSPKFSDALLATLTAERARGRTPIYRFVNADDLVTGLPPHGVEVLVPAVGPLDYQHLAYAGEGEEVFQVWVRDKTMEVSSFVFHLLYNWNDHLGYLAPLEFQARAHNQFH